MLALHKLLLKEQYPNCTGMAADLEVSGKTVQRDIDFMRDQLSLPIAYHPIRHGFYYTEHVRQFPTVQVSDGELVALLIAQKAVEQYRGTAFEKPLHSAFTKLADGLQGSSGIAIHELAEAISFRPQGLAEAELTTFQTLASATLKHHEITFGYHPLHRTTPESRRAHPYHLGCLANQWYLIAHDIDRAAMRTFALTRITTAQETGAAFEKPADFSVTEMFAGSFSAFQSGAVSTVTLALDPFAARLTAERSWHPSQHQTLHSDGSATLTLEVTIAPDLENWILGWGHHAEVIQPEALRKKIASIIASMQAIYSEIDRKI
jgi:proteasome accessory factor B